MSYCKNCGSELAETVKFCGKCGMKVDLIQDQYSANKQTKNQIKSSGNWINFILLFLSVSASIWLYLTFFFSIDWAGEGLVMGLPLILAYYMIGIVPFVIVSIWLFRKYKELHQLRTLIITNLSMVVCSPIILFFLMIIFADNEPAINIGSPLVNLFIIVLIIFNIFVVIKYFIKIYVPDWIS